MKNLILIKKMRLNSELKLRDKVLKRRDKQNKRVLVFREDAQKLIHLIYQKAEEKDLKIVYLDFFDIDFLSRSFIDEFLNGLNELKKRDIKIQFLNLQPSLRDFITQVKKTKRKIQKSLS